MAAARENAAASHGAGGAGVGVLVVSAAQGCLFRSGIGSAVEGRKAAEEETTAEAISRVDVAPLEACLEEGKAREVLRWCRMTWAFAGRPSEIFEGE